MKILFFYQSIEQKLLDSVCLFFSKEKNITPTYFQIENVYGKLIMTEINNQNKKISKLINDTDIVVWEGTQNNDLVLPIIEYSRGKKPLFVIQGHGKNFKLKKNPNKNWNFFQISYLGNEIIKALELVVKTGIGFVNRKLIFILPSEMNKYLEWNKDKNKSSKAYVIREALLEVIKNDTEYCNFLKLEGK
ncbi:MAG: hypothetical protein WCJ58_03745 [bacterium]